MNYDELRLSTIDWLDKIKNNAQDLRQHFADKKSFSEKLQHIHVMFSQAETNIIYLSRIKDQGVDPWQ
jgi:hypothetical protein